MLTWLGVSDVHKKLLLSRELTLKEKDKNNLKIKDSFLDEIVKIEIIQPYFSEKAFQILTNIIERKKEANNFFCEKCSKKAIIDVILCDSYRVWWHFECVQYNPPARKSSKPWFCFKCED